MFWISTEKALPAFTEQVVKIKVADAAGSYKTEGWYDHNKREWYAIKGNCVHDDVFAWKHHRPIKRLSREERERKMKEYN